MLVARASTTALDLNERQETLNVEKLTGSSPDRINACGGESAGLGHGAQVKLSPMKQEPNTFHAEA